MKFETGWFVSKTRSPGQIKGGHCLHSGDHIFEAIILNPVKMFVLMSRSSLKLGHLGKKTRSLGQIKGGPC